MIQRAVILTDIREEAPLWVLIWGGASTLVQALRPVEELVPDKMDLLSWIIPADSWF